MRIQNQELVVLFQFIVVAHSQDRVGQNSTTWNTFFSNFRYCHRIHTFSKFTYHHRSALSFKVSGKVADQIWHFFASGRPKNFRLNVEHGLENETHFRRADPLFAANEVRAFVAYVHQTFLDLAMTRYRFFDVTLQSFGKNSIHQWGICSTFKI